MPNTDPYSGNEIRMTDNGPRERDLAAPQESAPLEMDGRGLPAGWEAPDGDR